jgi:hypothetical protein
VQEIGIFLVTAVETHVGLCYAAALGTGALTSVTPVPHARNAPASGALLVTAWATASPTNAGIGAVFRRWHGGATIGNGVIWTFPEPDPLEITQNNATGELCLVNLVAVAPATMDVSITFRE